MLLRRITEHVKAQNWTAVALDFLIVVMGVFIGIQVSNWNDARQESLVSQSYLGRLGSDLSSMEIYLQDMIEEATERYDLSVGLLRAASNRNGNNDELVRATEAFFTNGWKTPRFTIVDGAYQDLTSTGNLNLIDADLRQKITDYYSDLTLRKEVTEINRDWSLPNDSRFIIDHDVYYWDLSLAEIAGADDPAIRHESIIDARSELARLAAMSVYVERALLDAYRPALAGTLTLAAEVTHERESLQ